MERRTEDRGRRAEVYYYVTINTILYLRIRRRDRWAGGRGSPKGSELARDTSNVYSTRAIAVCF